ncbi:Protein O-linked-mannose beta-1,4-N-acetylglucosaminyltransferase 2 [Rhizoclosmatium sp. JEL0117]|nr:Protein O-linked-mannose beta-1,4-N-acetylglucosaminyltransferase 2 [Rhizoclosmatium sp. JEL0117]
MRLRATSKDDDSEHKDKVPRTSGSRTGLGAAAAAAATKRRRVSLVSLVVAVLLAFSAGLLSSRLFLASSSAASSSLAASDEAMRVPPAPPQVKLDTQQQQQQQQQIDSWRKKYEDLLNTVKDSSSSSSSSAAAASKDQIPQGQDDPTKTKPEDLDEKSHKQEADDVKSNKEKERQMKELMKQSGDSVEGVKHKESEQLPVVGGVPDIVTMGVLPASSVWCQGDKLSNRVCKFRNICFNEKYQWFIVKNNASYLENVPTQKQQMNDVRPGVVEISTIEDHPYTAWSFDEVSQFTPEFYNRRVRYYTDFTVLFKRFHANNIMHTLHDDVIPLYHHIREVIGGYMAGFPHFDFDLRNHRIQFVDDYEITETFRPFQYLTDLPMGRLADLQEDKDLITCFRDATAGVRKLTTWYQYGFNGPQGPIDNKFVNGLHVRMVADFFTSRLGLPTQDYYGEENDLLLNAAKGKVSRPKKGSEFGTSPTTGVEYIGSDLIIILSRTRNRIIMNEAALAEHLERTFKHQVMLVRNEDHTLEEQIILMRRAKVLVAMHGSILILGMFCRKGTVILELYPWAVPSNNYTPYKTMSQLHGMHLVYRAWENKHPENSVSHPDWPEALGGISHLPLDEQTKILETPTVPPHKCCVDPYWLFRIYQDTIVDIPEVTAVLLDALKESATLMQTLSTTNPLEAQGILPPLVKGPNFMCMGPGRPKDALWIRWEKPWNGARPDYYVVRTRFSDDESEDPFTTYRADTEELFVSGFKPGTGIIYSVKSVVGDQETNFGEEAICIV